MTAIVSTFELLVKPIAPRQALPMPVRPIARRIVQGYFLTITNLEPQNLFFGIEFFDSPGLVSTPNRRLIPTGEQRNVDRLGDTFVDNRDLALNDIWSLFLSPLQGDANAYFFIPAEGTASIQLLPRLTPELLAQDNPQLEIRGHARLKFPVFRRRDSSNQGAQARVLLQPEIRGTFLPNGFPVEALAALGDFDHINYTLLTANGQGLNILTPELATDESPEQPLGESPQFYEQLDQFIAAGDIKAIDALLAEFKSGSLEQKQMIVV